MNENCYHQLRTYRQEQIASSQSLPRMPFPGCIPAHCKPTPTLLRALRDSTRQELPPPDGRGPLLHHCLWRQQGHTLPPVTRGDTIGSAYPVSGGIPYPPHGPKGSDSDEPCPSDGPIRLHPSSYNNLAQGQARALNWTAEIQPGNLGGTAGRKDLSGPGVTRQVINSLKCELARAEDFCLFW